MHKSKEHATCRDFLKLSFVLKGGGGLLQKMKKLFNIELRKEESIPAKMLDPANG